VAVVKEDVLLHLHPVAHMRMATMEMQIQVAVVAAETPSRLVMAALVLQ